MKKNVQPERFKLSFIQGLSEKYSLGAYQITPWTAPKRLGRSQDMVFAGRKQNPIVKHHKITANHKSRHLRLVDFRASLASMGRCKSSKYWSLSSLDMHLNCLGPCPFLSILNSPQCTPSAVAAGADGLMVATPFVYWNARHGPHLLWWGCFKRPELGISSVFAIWFSPFMNLQPVSLHLWASI